jgi:predicted PurR-regulated permease PerM
LKETNKEKDRRPIKGFWVTAFLLSVALIIFYKTVDKLPAVFAAIGDFIGILTPVILGLVIAFLLYKPMSKIEEAFNRSKLAFLSKHSRGLSVLICYLVTFAILGLTLYLVIPKIVMSIVNLVDSAPQYYNSVMKFLTEKAGEDGKLFGFDIESIKAFFNVEKILSYFDFSTITKYAGEIFKATGAIVDFFLSVVISVYLLLGKEHLIQVLGRLVRIFVSPKKALVLRDIVFRSSTIFYNYLYSQLIDAVIVMGICTVVFSLAKIPYAFLLAVLMGICNIVSYFGALIGGFGVVFITLISTGDLVKALIALVLVIGAQQLDANIIQPKVVADSVGIRPIYVLVAIAIGSGLFGFFGIILAVPVVAIIRMLILEYLSRKEKAMSQESTNEAQPNNI